MGRPSGAALGIANHQMGIPSAGSLGGLQNHRSRGLDLIASFDLLPLTMVSAVVLAAGMSTRMGRNKLLLDFEGKPVIVCAVDTLLKSDVAEVIVVLGHEADLVAERLAGKPVKLVQNPDYQTGQSSSLRAGVNGISSQSTAILIYLADQPLLEPSDINRLIRGFNEAKQVNKSIVVPFYAGHRGNPVILDASYRKAILEVVGDIGFKQVIKRNPDEIFSIEMDNDHVVRDVDDIEAYRELSRLPPST
jgi:molybdenum cofactor cytidylyltransferase